MKILNIVLKVILCLLLLSPILGATGIFPPPTPDLYNTPEAFAFIQMLFATGFVVYIEAIVFAAAIVLIIMKRTALAALLILPVTVNIVAFHLVLDGGLFTGGAVLADILLVLNTYFLWQNRQQYRSLWYS
jgi:putative oxidoreductase